MPTGEILSAVELAFSVSLVWDKLAVDVTAEAHLVGRAASKGGHVLGKVCVASQVKICANRSESCITELELPTFPPGDVLGETYEANPSQT